jgi:hypothetical protein
VSKTRLGRRFRKLPRELTERGSLSPPFRNEDFVRIIPVAQLWQTYRALSGLAGLSSTSDASNSSVRD